jgi:uncharacterized protein YndB with AHSA1/START domain
MYLRSLNMDIDFERYLGAVTRSVSSLERDGKPVRTVTLTRTYDTSVSDLWDAVTNPARIPRWFLPVTGELKLGGHFQLQGHAGGKILVCEQPKHLGVTWEFGGNTSWVDLHLGPDGTGARLTLKHILPVDDHWKQFGPGAVGVGWDLLLVGMTLHVTTKAAVDPKEFEAWSMSASGKAFIRGSSGAWGRADIAGGADAKEATDVAKKTAAFYTGETAG